MSHRTQAWLWLVLVGSVAAAEPISVQVDFGRGQGTWRALHGVNRGPQVAGGLIDLSAEHDALNIPWSRLHDCHWPNPDVVDIHAVFPNPEADPTVAAHYDFRLTDAYLASIRNTGAQIVYRLGESIEHTTIKRFVHPPKNVEHWTAICLGIIRHYNEGWADGFRYSIPYWEIWNEPENRPAMWSGNDVDYFRLYKTAARGIKERFPHLKVGGPAVGYSGSFVEGQFRPSGFVTNFLAMCRREHVPLDFFSWHCYTDNPQELVQRARAIRDLLDSHGFAAAESHLNEWNYLPRNSWKEIMRGATGEQRQRHYEEMSGAAGAAFIVTALLELQDAPVTMANLFHGATGGFGLFNEHGVPQQNYFAIHAFNQLVRMTNRVSISGAVAGMLALGAATDRSSNAAILLSQFAGTTTSARITLTNVPPSNRWNAELMRLSATEPFHTNAVRSITPGEPFTINLPSPGVILLRLRAE